MATTDLSKLLTSLGSTKTNITGVALDGGLNLKTDPQRLAPPSTTRADNAWHVQPGNVRQLPAFSSLLSDATLTAPLHIYNLGTRDLSSPAATGDLLIHGEYVDPPTNASSGFTRPMWSYNSGRTISQEVGCLPFSLRIRPMATNLGVSSNSVYRQPTVYGNQFVTAREENSGLARRRYMVGVIQNGSLVINAGYVDGLTRTTSQTLGSSVIATDMLGVQNSGSGTGGYAAILSIGSSTSTLYTLYYDLTSQNAVTIPTLQNYNAPCAQLFNHAGRTYLAYGGPSANTAAVFRDVVSGSIQQVTVSSTTAPANLAVGSPYTHQASASVTYLAMVFNRSLYVYAFSAGSWSIVAGPVALATPATSPSSGTYNYAATVCAMVADNQGGVGPSAKLSIVVYQHFPEVSGQTITNTPVYQSVLVAKYTFVAAATSPATTAGTITNITNNVFRTVAGAGLVSKAFCTNPPEANFAGPTAAKHALCVVQSGACEAEATTIFKGNSSAPGLSLDRDSQPTYFIIDQNADIVGRFLELSAATRPANFVNNGTNSAAASPAFPQVSSLANPLFSDGAGTGDDMSSLSITIPVWGALQFSVVPQYFYTSGTVTVPFQTKQMSNYTYAPKAVTLNFSSANAAPPALNVGAHTYIAAPCPMVHDGNGLTEQNYHFGAMNLVLGGAFVSGGTGTTAIFSYYIVYKWFDAQGRQHRSQPSIASAASYASTTQPTTLTYYVPGLNTTKNTIGLQVTADVYCTIANNTDDTAYLVDTVVVPTIPKSTAAPVMYASLAPAAQATPPAQLTAQPSMYTSATAQTAGRTYYSQPPKGSIWQVAAKGRCFSLAQISGQYRVYYSSVASDVLPFEWNNLAFAPVPPDIGDARSLEVIDDKVIVMGTRGNAVMTGDGPTGYGTVPSPTPGDGFSPVTPIPVPAGVVGTGSPARIPDGIIFQGYSGLQLIGRDLGITAIGAPVDMLTGRQVGNPGTVYGKGVTLPTLQSVVWANPRGPALVYSYLTQRFSTWPLLPNSCFLAQKMDGSIYAALQPISGTQLLPYSAGSVGADVGVLGSVYAPTSGVSSSPTLVLETPWVLLAGVSTGEADLWDMAIVGTWRGPHLIQVEQAYNYGAYSLTQTQDMTAQPLVYQTRWRPLQNSRVWAVRFRVSLLPVSSLNAGYPMADLADLVVYSDNQVGSTRVGQSQTR